MELLYMCIKAQKKLFGFIEWVNFWYLSSESVTTKLYFKEIGIMVKLPDIYFLPEWGEYYETKEQDGKMQIFEVNHELGQVFYQFVVRRIPIEIGGENYYDTITPYGFSGPIIIECNAGKKAELAAIFNEQFQKYCEEQNIVAEYIRFNPWLKNFQDFQDYYSKRNRGTTIFIDLTVDDFYMDEFSPKARTQVRRAQKSNVEIEFDFTGSTTTQGFFRLYKAMAQKKGFKDYDLFSEEFLRKSFESLEGKQFFINAKYEGQYVSSSFMLSHGDYLHYHLTANDPEFSHLAANSLIVYEACRWGVENGKKEVHLGSGLVEPIFKFKKGFTKTEPLELVIGKKIRNQDVYDELVAHKIKNGGIEDPNFFPLYRG